MLKNKTKPFENTILCGQIWKNPEYCHRQKQRDKKKTMIITCCFLRYNLFKKDIFKMRKQIQYYLKLHLNR